LPEPARNNLLNGKDEVPTKDQRIIIMIPYAAIKNTSHCNEFTREGKTNASSSGETQHVNKIPQIINI